MANPEQGLRYLDKLDAERSLMNYVRWAWPIHHPSRPLKEGRALHMMAEALEACAEGHVKKLLINVPPGFMKSLMVDVYFPTWLWGPKRMADRQFCSWSYGEEITLRDNRKSRELISSAAYQELWGDVYQLSGDQNQKKFFQNDKTGFRYAAGIHGGATGHRGDFLIIDDPHKVKETESETRRLDAALWFTETYPSRKNDDQAVFIIIMQRIHEGDVSGVALANSLGYEHMCIPMEFEHDHPYLWQGFDFPGASREMREGDWRKEDGELAFPERFPREEVEDLKRQLRAVGGDYAVAGQLQQRPVPRGGGMFKRACAQFVDEAPKRVVRRVRGWDLAATKNKNSPWTAGVKMSIDHEGRVFIEDVRKIQGSDYEVEQLLVETAAADGRSVIQDLPQDPGQAGKVQKRALARLLHGYDVKSSTESGQKEDRARPLSAQWESGNIFMVRGPWCDAFLNEACLFPNGMFKDQVDAASRAYARLIAKKKRAPLVGPEIIR